MSRYDADLVAAGDAEIEASELIEALGTDAVKGVDRYWVMARYLSGARGWREAGTLLQGTFGGFVAATGLTGAKEE